MVTTAERLSQLAQQSPDLNLTEAGQVVGVTRERVRQLANKHALPFYRGHHLKPRRPRPHCVVCGKELSYESKSARPRHQHCLLPKLHCIVCGGVMSVQPLRVSYLRQRMVKHRRCLMPTPPASCSVCGDKIQAGPEQRYQLRRNAKTQIVCKRPECRKAWHQRAHEWMLAARQRRRSSFSPAATKPPFGARSLEVSSRAAGGNEDFPMTGQGRDVPDLPKRPPCCPCPVGNEEP